MERLYWWCILWRIREEMPSADQERRSQPVEIRHERRTSQKQRKTFRIGSQQTTGWYSQTVHFYLISGNKREACSVARESVMRTKLSTTSIKKTKSITKNYKETSRPTPLPSELHSKWTAKKIDLSISVFQLYFLFLVFHNLCSFFTFLMLLLFTQKLFFFNL